MKLITRDTNILTRPPQSPLNSRIHGRIFQISQIHDRKKFIFTFTIFFWQNLFFSNIYERSEGNFFWQIAFLGLLSIRKHLISDFPIFFLLNLLFSFNPVPRALFLLDIWTAESPRKTP